jgi:cytochrome c553
MHKPEDGNALRPVPEMEAIVSGLSNQDKADLAAYFETQTSSIIGADPKLVGLGEQIYRSGNKKTNVPACTSCHQPDGAGLGLAGYPQLAGQFPAYTAKQLKAFRAAGREDLDAEYRVNDGESMTMRMSAKGLTDKEIQAVSAYVGGLMSKQQKKLSMEK